MSLLVNHIRLGFVHSVAAFGVLSEGGLGYGKSNSDIENSNDRDEYSADPRQDFAADATNTTSYFQWVEYTERNPDNIEGEFTLDDVTFLDPNGNRQVPIDENELDRIANERGLVLGENASSPNSFVNPKTGGADFRYYNPVIRDLAETLAEIPNPHPFLDPDDFFGGSDGLESSPGELIQNIGFGVLGFGAAAADKIVVDLAKKSLLQGLTGIIRGVAKLSVKPFAGLNTLIYVGEKFGDIEQAELVDKNRLRAELTGGVIGGLFGGFLGGLFAATETVATAGVGIAGAPLIVGIGSTVGQVIGDELGGIIYDNIEALAEAKEAIGQVTDLFFGAFKPVVLDLDGDGIEFTSLDESTVFFDIDADGFLERVGWVGADDGFLVVDLDGDGLVNAPEELALSKLTAADDTDLEAVATLYDSDNNGILDAQDTDFGKFRVWQDINQDGVSDEGEMRTLVAAGIKSVSLVAVGPEQVEDSTTVFGTTSYTLTDDTTREVADVEFGMSLAGFRIDSNAAGVSVTWEQSGPGSFFSASADAQQLDALSVGAAQLVTGDGADHLFTSGSFGVVLDSGAGDDTLVGGVGDDFLIGGAGADTLLGGDGDDVLFVDDDDLLIDGGNGNDVATVVDSDGMTLDFSSMNIEAVNGSDAGDILTYVGSSNVYVNGFGGNDTITTGSGDDHVLSGVGADTLSTGAGDDWLFVDAADTESAIDAGDGVDTIIVGTPAAVSFNLSNMAAERAFGNVGDDVISAGGAYGVQLHGGGGADTLTGGSGSDVIVGGEGGDSLDGGAGFDYVSYVGSLAGVTVNLATGTASGGNAEGDSITGFEGLIGSIFGDTITGTSGDDLIYTDGGDDTVQGGAGADILRGGSGVDIVSYEASGAAVTVDLGNDTVSGGDAQGDVIGDFEGVVGSAFADTLTGSAGDNFLQGGGGADVLVGGAGFDMVAYRSSSAGVTVDLAAQTASGGDATGDTISGMEGAIGSDQNDVLTGDDNDNVLVGGAGADTLTSAKGSDTLVGWTGADTLIGGEGADTILGGSGNDTITGDDVGGGGGGDSLKDEIETHNPVAYWRLGEATGTSAADIAGTAQNGTYTNGVVLGADGIGAISDTAADFDGVDDRVDVSHQSDLELANGTIQFWFKPDTLGTRDQGLMAKNNSGYDAGEWLIWMATNGKVYWRMEGGGSSNTLSTNTNDVTVGVWHHVAATFGSGGMKLYFDGVLKGTKSSRTDAMSSNALTMVIGAMQWGGSPTKYFDGKIDDVAILDFAVTDQQATDLYNAGINGTDNSGGVGGDDVLDGGIGNDNIDAGGGDDTVIGGAGSDSMTGGAGTDTLSYVNSTGGVTVNLGTGATSGNDAAGDTISSFEYLQGSAYDDTLTGDSGDNLIEGGAGGDNIDGGAGNDTVSYARSAGGVVADLSAGGGTAYEIMTTAFDDTNGNRHEGALSFDANDDSLVTHGSGTSLVYGEGAGNIDGWMVASLSVHPGGATGSYSSAAILSEIYTVTTAGDPPVGKRYVKVSTGSDSTYVKIYDAAGALEIQYNFIGDASQGATITFSYNRDTGDLSFYKNGKFAGTHKWATGLNVMAGHIGVDGQVVRIDDSVDLRLSHGLLNDDARNDSFTSIENLTGSNFNDELTGDSGANTLTGGSGNDELIGGAGTDAAVFAGNAASYSVVDNSGTVTVTDLDDTAGGDDGTDTLTGIESLVFADRTLTLDSSTNNAPVATDGSAMTYEDHAIDGKLSGYDIGAVSTVLTYSLVGADGGATNGTATILDSSAGTYRYTPDAGYTGTDSFTFRVTDAAGTPLSDDATVSVDVKADAFEIEYALLLSYGTAQELSITPVSAGNRKTFTFSTWAKRGRLDANSRQILSAGVEILRFSSTGQLQLVDGATELRTTTATFQDDDWRNIVLSVDTTQAIATDRIKLYVDGAEITSFSASNDPALNEDFEINSTALHRISIGGVAYDQKFDGYLADIRFIDGQALDANTFGTTSGTAWLPRGDSGGYGANGYRLDFADDLAMGNDVSGNNNDWTATAMVVENRVTNTPTHNYMVLDDTTAATGFPLDYISQAGTIWAVQETAWDQRHGTERFSSGKRYWEVKIHFLQSPSAFFGITQATALESMAGAPGGVPSAYGYGLDGGWIHLIGDTRQGFQSHTIGANGQVWNNNDVIGIAVDADTGRLWMRRNGGTWFEGDPETGAAGNITWLGGTSITPWLMTYGTSVTTNAFEINFGQQDFAFAAPAGFDDLGDPSSDSEAVEGTVGADVVVGTIGDDTLSGGSRDDILEGREGADTLDGGSGDDTLDGGAGADVISGGLGLDRVTLAASAAGVTVNLAQGTGLGGDAEGDTYSGIENVTGSALADVITGTSADNILDGGAGDDTINGGAGADSLVGGDGTDTLSYAGSSRGVTVDLAAATVSGGDAEGDTISGFENITGSDRDDTLTGDGGANTLLGGGGDDVLDAGAVSLNTDTFETAIAAHNPVGYWRLGESTGTTAADDAGVAQNGTYTNGVTLGAAGIGSISDTAADFDGVDDRVDVSHNSDLELANGTIQFWFKPDTLGTGDQGLMAKNNSGYDAGSWLIYMSTSGKVHYRVEGSGSASSISTNTNDVTVGAWNNVAATFGSGGMKLYFNGVLKGTRSRTDAMSSNTLAMVIGALQWGGSPSKYFNGKIDEVAILDFAVTDQQASDLYDDGIAAIDSGSGSSDTLDGGAGTDTVSYAASSAGVTVDLSAGTGSGGDAAGDVLANIENVTGSAFNDAFTSSSADNAFDGGAGTDSVTFAGNAADYSVVDSAGILTVGDLDTTAGGDDGTDTLTGIESLVFADKTLTLDGATNNAPVATDGSAAAVTDTVIEGRLAAFDVGAGSTALTYSLVGTDGGALNGSVTILDSSAGTYRYTPDTGYTGTDSFTFRATDAAGTPLSDDGVVSVTFYADTLGRTLAGSSGNDALIGTALVDSLTGGGRDDVLDGKAGADVLDGGAGDDTLTGGVGADALTGGTGTDLADYAGSTAGVTVDLSAGTGLGGDAEGDTLAGIENITGSGQADVLTGDSGVNVLDGGAGDDTVSGGAGADSLIGGTGSDTLSYAGSAGGVTVDLAAGTVSGGDAAGDTFSGFENATGSGSNDTLIGDSNANTLDGGAGVDTVSYSASSAGVTVDLSAGTGSGGDAAGDVLTNIENVTGSAFNDAFTGSSADNAFVGGAGTDSVTFVGNAADYSVVDNSGTVTVVDLDATAGGDDGTDTLTGIESLVFADKTLTLDGATNNAPVATDGSAAAVTDTVIEGRLAAFDVGAGSTALTYSLVGADGGAVHGSVTILDSLAGTYRYTPDTGYTGTDSFTFRATDGAGTPLSDDGVVSVTFYADTVGQTLAGSSGNDALIGTAQVDSLTGGGRDDVLDGKGGADVLDGGAGDDTLTGGAGADALTGGTGTDLADYAGSSAGVTVDLSAGTGLGGDAEGDTLASIENITGSGQADVLTGDGWGNVLDGGAGDDTVNGGAGADSLIGGTGSDTLSYAGSAGGVTVDLAAGTVSGGDAAGDTFSGFENATGSGNNDTLIGDSGANTLDGGAGTDVLDGGLGSDTYLFGRGSDTDIIVNGDATVATDNVLFGASIDKNQLWFQRDEADLNVSIVGTGDELVLRDWYGSAQKRVDTFETAGADSLTEANVQQLVAAMAAFNPPSGSSLDLPQAILDDLQPTLAAAWT